MVVAVEVNGSPGYSYADCTYLRENQNSTHFGTRCFCYNSGTMIRWKDIWSTFQVHVKGDEGVYIMYPMEGTRNCYEPDHFLVQSQCMLDHYWHPSPRVAAESMDIPLEREEVCFMVKTPSASSEHTLHIRGKRMNRGRFVVFACGLALFYFAGVFSRSSWFFYTSGISVGVLSIVLFLLLILKRFIPLGLFVTLFVAGSVVSYLGHQALLSHWDDVVSLYWRHALGYLLASGLISWLACYKHGPIRSERVLGLLTWGLQGVAVGLMYYGVTYPMAFYTLLGLLLLFKALPRAFRMVLEMCRLTGCLLAFLLSVLRRLFSKRKPQLRLLSEEEYREQGEVHTKASLEALRKLCNTPAFPAWDTVLRLTSPQRFAEFLKGGVHVSAEEQQNHDQHYGPGGTHYEDMLFTSDSHRALGLASDVISNDKMNSYAQAPPTADSLPRHTVTTPMLTPMPRPEPAASCPPRLYSTFIYPHHQPPYPPSPVALPSPPTPHVIPDDEDEDMDLF
ncbi:hypothetical protein DPEC_G00138290 [Dallia pectoralis]|uniref:Uncharacterized protein n=1 Tax=Dallia pectoralis TaxID=75939 RepID=A0ACC2GMF1_DALPE|nr:hypothetical protein DPEC_G00138290 [Dallia pectoralis]